MNSLEELARIMDALGHPMRLRIIALLRMNGQLYLADIAKRLGVSRALAKVHLNKLQKAGLVTSRVELVPGEARALRYYQLVDFKVTVYPDYIVKLMGGSREQ
ncbi:MAG: ArsR/SmtB family transcription factor [Vulcanisaeta sp.]|uniref:ArsR/SmtB family transcription factor n=1 Tax=Vulcanisaeta sp. TaxID=2020871 RepID=UPI003D09B1F2